MKKYLLIIAVAVLFSSCLNEDGWQVKLPDSMAIQWLGEDHLPDGTLWNYQVWDFSSNKDRLSILYYKSLDDVQIIPNVNISSKYIFSYDCRYKDGIYTITINDEDKTRVFLSDVTDKSMILTFEDGFSMNMIPMPFKIILVPVDY